MPQTYYHPLNVWLLGVTNGPNSGTSTVREKSSTYNGLKEYQT